MSIRDSCAEFSICSIDLKKGGSAPAHCYSCRFRYKVSVLANKISNRSTHFAVHKEVSTQGLEILLEFCNHSLKGFQYPEHPSIGDLSHPRDQRGELIFRMWHNKGLATSCNQKPGNIAGSGAVEWFARPLSCGTAHISCQKQSISLLGKLSLLNFPGNDIYLK